ncbi:MAG: alcohol dehydrogenase catalytic domain-containing protein [Ignavibacteriales bacterium]|nr:alcohol dehydrogenase catalytic domain-containing protein [Ignavibacteriales bacterium]
MGYNHAHEGSPLPPTWRTASPRVYRLPHARAETRRGVGPLACRGAQPRGRLRPGRLGRLETGIAPHPGADGAGDVIALGGLSDEETLRSSRLRGSIDIGDRVVINANLGCGQCEYCLAGKTICATNGICSARRSAGRMRNTLPCQ